MISIATGCKTTQVQNDTVTETVGDSSFKTIITISEKLRGDYFTADYSAYNPINIKNTNKATNEYSIKWIIDQAQWDKLAMALNQDENIKTIRLSYDQ